MRSPEDVFQELEEDRAVRESEIRLIENFISRSSPETEKVMLRRTLVLLTYAHLEGFCKFSLMAYAAAVIRNAIAHGDRLKEPKESDVRDYLSAAFDVMKFVQSEIFDALSKKAYQKDASAQHVPTQSFMEKALRVFGLRASQ